MFDNVLVANRGEIAVRIIDALAEFGAESVAVYSPEDAGAAHVVKADRAVALEGRGPAAYLDVDRVVEAASSSGCDAVHPGYGFLSENADLAHACERAGLAFVGPSAGLLELFGDKLRAKRFASECGVPVTPFTTSSQGPEAAEELLASLPAGGSIMIKAVAGGGGRGIRVVSSQAEVRQAYAQAMSEARTSFGSDEVYAEAMVGRARHVEVQTIGDGQDVTHLWDRECTLQRRRQKLIELAPSPSLEPSERRELCDAAVRLAREAGLVGLATFEFLIDLDRATSDGFAFVFMEANPRLQVEHTVTEMVTGIDLVQAQLAVCAGRPLADLALVQSEIGPPRGTAVQVRVNAESIHADGHVVATGGEVASIALPGGPGVRIDTALRVGYRPSPAFDSLVAKVVVHTPAGGLEAALSKAGRALESLQLDGLTTNRTFQQALLEHPAVRENHVHTLFVEEHLPELLQTASELDGPRPVAEAEAHGPGDEKKTGGLAEDQKAVTATMLGTVISVDVAVGEEVGAGRAVAVLESMKMEHVVATDESGVVADVLVAAGDTVDSDTALITIVPRHVIGGDAVAPADEVDLDAVPAQLRRLRERLDLTRDEGRPDAVAKRHALGHRTARENIDDLVDEGSLIEYGALGIAPQRARYSHDELLKISPADGVVTGLASVNGDVVGRERSQAAVIAYDWTVFAGTQGILGHKKTDRLLNVAYDLKLPVIIFAEGGGGRPGDTELVGAAGLDIMSFAFAGRLSGHVPLVGIANRYTFAGNAAILAVCDVIIATRESFIGMGGPAMIEGGGLGKVDPREIGPSDVQTANGVIDVLVEDEEAAVHAARKYLSFFQGDVAQWTCADQRALRHVVPENRRRSYDVRTAVEVLADDGSVLELRPDFGVGVVTALARVEGHPVGIVANDCRHLGGAVDSDAADKSSRFMQLCDAFGIPLVVLCDTPGFMVGPMAERAAQVRHFGRLFAVGANVSTPVFAFVLRKGYGLGALASVGGGFRVPKFIASWPTGEFGGMGLEGHVRLAHAKELAAIEDEDEREREFQRRVDELYEKGSAFGLAEDFEIDAVIDPAESRRWIVQGIRAARAGALAPGGRRDLVHPW